MWRGAPSEFTRSPFVRLRQAKTTGIWKIYWRVQTGKCALYAAASTAKNLTVALAMVEADPYGGLFGYPDPASPSLSGIGSKITRRQFR